MDTKPADQTEQDLDESLEETFPASDPPALGGSTGPGHLPAAGEKRQ
jgi:hypothetical protein